MLFDAFKTSLLKCLDVIPIMLISMVRYIIRCCCTCTVLSFHSLAERSVNVKLHFFVTFLRGIVFYVRAFLFVQRERERKAKLFKVFVFC